MIGECEANLQPACFPKEKRLQIPGGRKRGGNWRILCVSIITPPLLTLNMREIESMKSDVKINTRCDVCKMPFYKLSYNIPGFVGRYTCRCPQQDDYLYSILEEEE